MKKIMFNDRHGLTAAVLEGRKTMTRRVVKGLQNGIIDVRICEGVCECLYEGASRWLISSVQPKYKVGEIVAVAQRYSDIAEDKFFVNEIAADELTVNAMKYEHGWNNKQGVKACYMPHHIRITNIKVERLKDISREDCMKEGILNKNSGNHIHKRAYPFYFAGGKHVWDNSYSTPRQAFAALIGKVSGKGTWDSNPYVFAYTFELVKGGNQ